MIETLQKIVDVPVVKQVEVPQVCASCHLPLHCMLRICTTQIGQRFLPCGGHFEDLALAPRFHTRLSKFFQHEQNNNKLRMCTISFIPFICALRDV